MDGLSKLLVGTITTMMAADPGARPCVDVLTNLNAVVTARDIMKRNRLALIKSGGNLFKASAFATEPPSFLLEVLGPKARNGLSLSLLKKPSYDAMDTSD